MAVSMISGVQEKNRFRVASVVSKSGQETMLVVASDDCPIVCRKGEESHDRQANNRITERRKRSAY